MSELNVLDILTPKRLPSKQSNFSKLSLSQNKRSCKNESKTNSSVLHKEPTSANSNQYGESSTVLSDLKVHQFCNDNKKTDLDITSNKDKNLDSKISFLKVRNISELLKSPQQTINTTNWIGAPSDIKKNESVTGNSLVISSDDDSGDFRKKNTTSQKSIKSKTTTKTRRKRNKNKDTENKNITSLKTTKVRNTIKEEKIIIQRKLTKSTNLKTFASKYQPPNQTRIDSFFKVMPNENTVKYFDTFEGSKPRDGITDKCVTDYLEIVMSDMERMKRVKVSLPTDDIISLSSTDEDETNNLNINENEDIQPPGSYLAKEISVRKPVEIENNRIAESDNSCNKASLEDDILVRKDQVIETKEKSECSHSFVPENTSKSLTTSDSDSSEFCNKSVQSVKTGSLNNLPTEKISDPPKQWKRLRKPPSSTTLSSIGKNNFVAKKQVKNSKQEVRKRLNFKLSVDTLSESDSSNSQESHDSNVRRKLRKKRGSLEEGTSKITKIRKDCITDSDSQCVIPRKRRRNVEKLSTTTAISTEVTLKKRSSSSLKTLSSDNSSKNLNTNPVEIDLTSVKTPEKKQKRAKQLKKSEKNPTNTKRKTIDCPDYKIIEGTTFAVDAFRFGYIEGVTHYFLTHFHADHYIGLKKSFNMPIFMSEITARLVNAMIGTDEQYLNVVELNKTITINDIEVTAIDANHCPGAIMFLFKQSDGKCILHTGDFRASPDMECEPIFWNNLIHTIYLDTTYLSHRYAFKPQFESVDDAVNYVEEFREKYIGEKILIICGSYVVGKEKIWMAIAKKFNLTVWMEGNRKKTLKAINDENMLRFLEDNPLKANIHVLSMNKLSNNYLWEYLNKFTDTFDMILAIRPSGWEKNSKPQFRGKINIIGIEYSEHSSYDELRRFVRFLNPYKIISTVPHGNDLSKTTKIPKSWFQNDLNKRQIGYQSSITNYIKLRSKGSKSTECKKKTSKANEILNEENDDETDGVVLDATKSNLNITESSVIDSPFKYESKNMLSQKTASEKVTDWMS